MVHIDNAERRRRLGVRHGLAFKTRSVIEATGAVVGLHATDPATVYLTIRARLQGFEPDALETALYTEKQLLRILAMRRTMFVTTPEMAEVMNAACTRALLPPQTKRIAKAVEESGVSTSGVAWLQEVKTATIDAMGELGPATASEIGALVPEFGLKLRMTGAEVGVSTRILFLLATEGRIIRGRPRGSWRSSLYEWALIDDWLPGWNGELEERAARARLIRAWLKAFGPAEFDDAKWWTGWGVRDTRAALEASGAVEVGLDAGAGFVAPGDVDSTPGAEDWVGMLPALDPTIMGWKRRDWYLKPEYVPQLFDRNGNAGPTIWSGGRVVGGWGQDSTGAVRFQLLEDVGSQTHSSIETEAHRLETWLNGVVVIPRFRTPLDKKLSA